MSLEKWKNLAKRATRGGTIVWVSVMALVLLVGILLSAAYWQDLRGPEDSLSTAVRNVALVIGGVIAALLAVWRSRVAERQANTPQQGLLNERYQKGAEMLGSDVLSVRMGGLFALQRLAEEHPNEYHMQVLRLFGAFVRHPTKLGETEVTFVDAVAVSASDDTPFDDSKAIREDVQAAMEAIGYRSNEGITLEKQADFKLDLRGADLRHTRLYGAHLSGADLTEAKLRHAQLTRADLSSAVLWHADLSWEIGPGVPVMSATRLDGANLSGANLMYANLAGARLQEANLCQANLFEANLHSAFLYRANLSNADIGMADLRGAVLDGANVSNLKLGKGEVMGSWLTLQQENATTRLTQDQLDKAFVESGCPPQLNGVLDDQAEIPLEWKV